MTVDTQHQYPSHPMAPSLLTSTSAPNIVAESILLELQATENEANEQLIEILGLIRPSKSSVSSASSIVRGLFTKNSKLLALLFSKLQAMRNGEIDVKEAYKTFVNEFILWIDQDGIVLFEKYCNLVSIGDDNINLNKNAFSKPIINLNNYINFIDKSVNILRNPFVLEKLQNVKEKLIEIVNLYDNTTNTNELNDISFNNIQIFGTSNNKHRKASKQQDKVSSFFRIDQIVDRSFNEEVCLVDENIPVELVLLNVTNHGSNRFNALAIISIDCKVRSLMYPPFRVNELSMYHENDTIVLKSIDFLTSGDNAAKIRLKFTSKTVLEKWTQQLLMIFPFQEDDSPVSETFLISSELEPPKMSGLGIDYFSDSERKKSIDSSNNNDKPRIEHQFKEIYSPDSFSSNESPISQLIKHSKSSAIDDFKDIAPPPFINTRRKFSDSSAHSAISIDSTGTQHNERSLHVINKALSNSSSKFKAVTDGSDNHVKEIKRSTLSLSSSESDFQERPISSHAEIQAIEPTPSFRLHQSFNESTTSFVDHPPTVDSKFASVPNLSETKHDNNVYQLSTGSAIDISNFGKNHQPTFLSESYLNNESSTSLSTEKAKKKSLFRFFKKTSKSKDKSVEGFQIVEKSDSIVMETPIKPFEEATKPDAPTKKDFNKKKLEINTNINPASVEEGPTSVSSEASSIAKPSTIPAAFALPSSTSTYFFKPFANGSTNSLSQSSNDSQTNLSIPEEDLKIPQELKDIINNDESIDFYISNNSPKTMIISKWKEKYGKWEMITTNEQVFVKIVVNYILNKSWLIFFKEEYDQTYEEEIDKPILLLDIVNNQTTIRQSALDLQINAVNAITLEKMNIMVRCKNGSLTSSLKENTENVLGVLNTNAKGNESLRNSKQVHSDSTITSSIMDNRDKPSTSSTLTSINTIANSSTYSKSSKTNQEYVSRSLDSDKITAHTVLNNPENSRLIVLYSMTVRLQKQLESYEKRNIPSSWKILSMYSLSIFVISDNFTNKNYYNLVLGSNENAGQEDEFSWLISEDDKFTKLERIGKAGLLVKMSDSEIFMIECRGKKELKQLFEKFAL